MFATDYNKRKIRGPGSFEESELDDAILSKPSGKLPWYQEIEIVQYLDNSKNLKPLE